MLYESARIGDRLEIQHKFEKKPLRAYVSQIQDILQADQFVALAPMEYGNIIRIPNNDSCVVIMFTEKGIIKCAASVIKNVVKDGVYYIVLKILDEGEKIQRRDFFRFDCMLDFTFGVVDNDMIKNGKVMLEECHMKGIVKDIGGGGIRFVSNDDIPEKVDICCVIPLNDDVILPIGTVLHKQHFPKSNFIYQYRAQFFGMPQSEQEKIVHFIFNEQRKTLKRTKEPEIYDYSQGGSWHEEYGTL